MGIPYSKTEMKVFFGTESLTKFPIFEISGKYIEVESRINKLTLVGTVIAMANYRERITFIVECKSKSYCGI